MKWIKGLKTAGVGVSLVLGLSACKGDPNQTKLGYMPDMADAPIVKPQRDYLNPPEGSVAMYSILYPKTSEESGRLLENPLAGQENMHANLADGAYLYAQVCVACHGPEAKGDGTIIDKYPQPPDITAEAYASKPDGFFFHTITFGSAIMPYMGDKLDPIERWKIVLHLRSLQQQHGKKADQP